MCVTECETQGVCAYLCLYVAVCKCMSVCLSGSVVYVCVCERVGSVRWKRLECVSKLRRVSGKGEVTRKLLTPRTGLEKEKLRELRFL